MNNNDSNKDFTLIYLNQKMITPKQAINSSKDVVLEIVAKFI